MQSSVQLLLRLDMQPTSITANLKVTVCSCSPANNVDRSRSEDVRNAEGGIPKGKSKFGPFYTFEHLSGGGGGCQSSSYSEMCLRNVYSVDRQNFIHSFFTFKLSKQQVYKTYIGFYYTSSFYHCCLNSHRVSLSVCLSVCLYVCCSRGGEIFVLWTVKLELQQKVSCIWLQTLPYLSKTIGCSEQRTRLVLDSTHSQTLVVLCGQRLTSGRCLFMRAVNTGSGRLYSKTHTQAHTHEPRHTKTHTHLNGWRFFFFPILLDLKSVRRLFRILQNFLSKITDCAQQIWSNMKHCRCNFSSYIFQNDLCNMFQWEKNSQDLRNYLQMTCDILPLKHDKYMCGLQKYKKLSTSFFFSFFATGLLKSNTS